jgi:DNA-binding MarR family transcriptional regulator
VSGGEAVWPGSGGTHKPAFDALTGVGLTWNPGIHGMESLSTRQRAVMEIIHHEPGLNLQELADRLDLHRTAVKHHVRRLARTGHVILLRKGRHVLHFTKWMSGKERTTLAWLRVGSVRAIVSAVFEHPGISVAKLSANLEISPRTVRATLRVLVHEDLIHLTKSPGVRTRQVHLDREARLVWARWFDPAQAAARPTSLRDKPDRLTNLGLLFLPWLWSWGS